jgi:hypothetical protein
MNRVLTALVSAAALWTAACSSGGGQTIPPPPPVGKYSNASLNGQYAFVTSGEVLTGNTITPLARVGSFTADGLGHITGGVEDVNADGQVSNASAITGGTYTVNADGRGFMNLIFGQASIDLGITLTSTSDGLLIDETSNSSQASTGSGNFIKQNSALFAVTSIAGPYVFDFSGLDASQQIGCPCPESLVGQFSVASGVINPGSFDDNDNTTLSNGSFTGTLATDPLNPQEPITNSGRGIALIAGQDFVFYIVDSSRVRFISTNLGMLSGDAVLQSNAVPASLSAINSAFAFIVAGSSPNGGLTRVGRLTANGATLNQLLMDVNDATNEIQFNNLSNGSISAYDATTGRGTFSFQDSNATTYSFVFYLNSPSGGVIQDVSPSNTAGFARVVADGSILAQSGSPFTSSKISGTYAMNWSGLVVAGGSFPIEDEEDLLAQVTVSNLNLSGTADFFQFTSAIPTPQFDIGVGGSITIAGDGTSSASGQRNNMNVNLSNTTPIHLVVYFVNPQLAFFANRDNNGTPRIVAGILKAQN